MGMPHEVNGIKILPLGRNSDGSDIIQYHLDTIKPDIFAQLLDMWMNNKALEIDFTPIKFAMYVPLDGYPIPAGCEKHLLKADKLIAMSKFGKKLIDNTTYHDTQEQKMIPISERLTAPVDYIAHGVTTDLYKPASENEKIDFIRKNVPQMEGKFVVGCVARNQPRKALPETLKIFKEFAKDKNDVILYLHSDPYDPQGANLPIFTKMINLNPELVNYTQMQSFSYGVSDETLAKIYNVFDVHFLGTTGEGFGLPLVEAASSGLPQVVTNYTTSSELLGVDPIDPFWPPYEFSGNAENEFAPNGILVPPSRMLTGSYLVERAYIDIKKAVEALQYMYDNPSERKKMGVKARKMVVDKYDWNVIAKQWESLFSKMVND